MLFFKKADKRLDVTPIETVFVDFPEQCLAACTNNDRCLAFNVDYSHCELFARDRCTTDKVLNESQGTNYFDTVAEDQCQGE